MNMDRPSRWLVLPVMLLVAVALGLLALLLVKANPAEGALPGDNGRIVFVSSGEIYTMMPDGTDIKQLTSNAAADGQPAWSPDGTQIAFTSNRDAIRAGDFQIYKMDADGTNQIRLTTDSPLYDRRVRPAWSPNGDQIAFSTDGSDGTLDVLVMDPNGNNVRDLTEDSEVFGFGADSAPAWSPDGTQIAFESASGIYKMDASGSNLTYVAGGTSPDWGVSAPPPPPDIDSVNQEAAAGETVSTSNGAEPTASDPIASWVTTPLAGKVSIEESPSITETPLDSAYTFFGQQVDISVPGSSTSDNPYKLEFALDSSLIPSGENADTIQLFRNGARLPDCTGAEGTAEPDPCVWSRTQLGSNGDVKITAYTSNASSWNFGRLSDQPSVASNDSYATDEDTALNQPAPGVLSNDTDPENDSLTAEKVSDPSHGTLTLDPDGSFAYTPNGGFSGSDSFTYKANDGTSYSNVATVDITVNAVNDAPVAVDDTATTDEDTAAVIPVLSNDTDADGDSLSVVGSSLSHPAHGTVELITSGTDAGKVRYTPNANYNGSDTFTYKAK